MRTSQGWTNDTGFISDRFIQENMALSVPYLILLVMGTLSGSIGNTMVLGAVIIYKVRGSSAQEFCSPLPSTLIRAAFESRGKRVASMFRLQRQTFLTGHPVLQSQSSADLQNPIHLFCKAIHLRSVRTPNSSELSNKHVFLLGTQNSAARLPLNLSRNFAFSLCEKLQNTREIRKVRFIPSSLQNISAKLNKNKSTSTLHHNLHTWNKHLNQIIIKMIKFIVQKVLVFHSWLLILYSN